jgi:hypothetical protein
VDKWRKGVKIRFVRTGGAAALTCLVSGGSAAGFYPQALGDETRGKEAGFPHPTGPLNRWGIAPDSPPYLGGRATRQKPKLEEFSPVHRGYPQFFASYPQPCTATGLLHDIQDPPYMGSNLRPWTASKEKENVTIHLPRKNVQNYMMRS